MEAAGSQGELKDDEVELATQDMELVPAMLPAREPRTGIPVLLTVGFGGTHVLAALLVVTTYAAMSKHFGLVMPVYPLGGASFAAHPMLMVLAYGFFGSTGLIAFRTYGVFLRLERPRVKKVHAAMQFAALVVGLLGVRDMYLVHAQAADKQVEKGWAVHYQSLHSWIGLTTVMAWSLQWLLGFTMFYLPWCPGSLRAATLPAHVLMGALSFFMALVSIVTGFLSLGFRGDNEAEKDVALKRIGMLALGLAATIGMVFHAPKVSD